MNGDGGLGHSEALLRPVETKDTDGLGAEAWCSWTWREHIDTPCCRPPKDLDEANGPKSTVLLDLKETTTKSTVGEEDVEGG